MYSGLGDNGGGVPVLKPVLSTGISVAGGIASAAAAPGALTAGALAVPLIGAAIAGVTLAIGLWMNRMGPKQKVAATKVVEDAEQLFRQNFDAWQSSNKTQSEQRQSLANFDQIWNSIVAACGDPQMGDPGKRCINERKPGGVYDVAKDWRTPILNDPDVRPDLSVVDEAFAGLGVQSNSLIPALLIGGLILLAVSK